MPHEDLSFQRLKGTGNSPHPTLRLQKILTTVLVVQSGGLHLTYFTSAPDDVSLEYGRMRSPSQRLQPQVCDNPPACLTQNMLLDALSLDLGTVEC